MGPDSGLRIMNAPESKGLLHAPNEAYSVRLSLTRFLTRVVCMSVRKSVDIDSSRKSRGELSSAVSLHGDQCLRTARRTDFQLPCVDSTKTAPSSSLALSGNRFGNDDRAVIIIHSPSGIFDQSPLNCFWTHGGCGKARYSGRFAFNFNWVHSEEGDYIVTQFWIWNWQTNSTGT